MIQRRTGWGRVGSARKVASGLVLASALGTQCHQASPRVATEGAFAPAHAAAATRVETLRPTTSPAESAPGGESLNPVADLAKRDPLQFLHYCREQYDGNVRDYTCTFAKQELLGRSLTPIQEIAVRFRESPYSVDMHWRTNAADATRAVYVRGMWKDASGAEQAWVRPAGALVKLIVPKIKQSIHGALAKRASRRSLDQFGFRNTLDLVIHFADLGRERGVGELTYVGEGALDDRPTFVFDRRLPYDGDEDPYPDAFLRFHIDQEMLVPTGTFSYADAEGRVLLGSYVLTDVRLNVGLGDDDFDPEKMNF